MRASFAIRRGRGLLCGVGVVSLYQHLEGNLEDVNSMGSAEAILRGEALVEAAIWLRVGSCGIFQNQTACLDLAKNQRQVGKATCTCDQTTPLLGVTSQDHEPPNRECRQPM